MTRCRSRVGLRRAVPRVGVDDYSSESDVIIIPSALDFVSQDEMLTPLGRLDKYAASENIFNSCFCDLEPAFLWNLHITHSRLLKHNN
ncbi:PREDICTED: serine/threonine-protein phosphatase 4 regulatory subunit 1-like isoform X2 [Sturnus vulgaris]|uniref:serine/threonine-protein phosphatase 4 regulatory subunit 1-like isoform X2 n=1 Tax=Sturnus vulgaris TaxID=9172 RepID=UPI00071A9174|nr:PREDICTED: serine/threonine-protein phosphatase 4 regulatory subunit 1-like isoform X2 [Sturnus vulgaris]